MLESAIMSGTSTLEVNVKRPIFSNRDLRKTFSKLYRKHLISKLNVWLKKRLLDGLSVPEFYGVFVYKFKRLIGRNYVSLQFGKIIIIIIIIIITITIVIIFVPDIH